jgi:hypothetical protein
MLLSPLVGKYSVKPSLHLYCYMVGSGLKGCLQAKGKPPTARLLHSSVLRGVIRNFSLSDYKLKKLFLFLASQHLGLMQQLFCSLSFHKSEPVI